MLSSEPKARDKDRSQPSSCPELYSPSSLFGGLSISTGGGFGSAWGGWGARGGSELSACRTGGAGTSAALAT